MIYRVAKGTAKVGAKSAFYGAIAMSHGPKHAAGVYVGQKAVRHGYKTRKYKQRARKNAR